MSLCPLRARDALTRLTGTGSLTFRTCGRPSNRGPSPAHSRACGTEAPDSGDVRRGRCTGIPPAPLTGIASPRVACRRRHPFDNRESILRSIATFDPHQRRYRPGVYIMSITQCSKSLGRRKEDALASHYPASRPAWLRTAPVGLCHTQHSRSNHNIGFERSQDERNPGRSGSD